jgi:hypothetical protein
VEAKLAGYAVDQRVICCPIKLSIQMDFREMLCLGACAAHQKSFFWTTYSGGDSVQEAHCGGENDGFFGLIAVSTGLFDKANIDVEKIYTNNRSREKNHGKLLILFIFCAWYRKCLVGS